MGGWVTINVKAFEVMNECGHSLAASYTCYSANQFIFTTPSIINIITKGFTQKGPKKETPVNSIKGNTYCHRPARVCVKYGCTIMVIMWLYKRKSSIAWHNWKVMGNRQWLLPASTTPEPCMSEKIHFGGKGQPCIICCDTFCCMKKGIHCPNEVL